MAERIAILGTGIMGSAMGRQLLSAGFDVTAWNRNRARTRPLSDLGVVIADSPASAVAAADIVLTALTDGDAVRNVMLDSGALASMDPSAVWVQVSTIDPVETQELRKAAERIGVGFVDAPVLGTKEPAERGELTILASGEEALKPRCEGIFSAIGGRTLWLGEAGNGTKLKLVVNNWLVGLVGTLAETLHFADYMGVNEGAFFAAIEGSAVDSGYAQIKGRAMLDEAFDASFPLRLAFKDLNLVISAASRENYQLPIASTVMSIFSRAMEEGYGDNDMAAVYMAMR